MATNDFLPFAAAGGANVLSQSDWLALAARLSGYTAGVATSSQINKGLRQSAAMSAMLGQLISTYGLRDALDDGNSANLLAAFAGTMQLGAWNWAGTLGGTANALTATLTPALPAYTAGLVLAGIANNTNTSGTVTIAVNGLSARAIKRTGGADLRVGDLISGGVVILRDNGSYFEIQNPRLAGLPIASQSFSTPGISSVTVPATATAVRVRLWAGGGSGGSAAPGTLAAGGGAGGYAEGIYAVTPGSTILATVGAGGAAPAAGNNNGNTGGSSSFGPMISATGGLGGGSASTTGVSGGTGVGGQLNLTGQASSGGFSISTSVYAAGAGGSAPQGGGGALYPVTAVNSGLNGNAGIQPGGGGSGAASTMTWNTDMSGGAGGAGLILLEWF